MLYGFPHNEWCFKHVTGQMWILLSESLSSRHDAFHKLNASSRSADEVVGFRRQKLSAEYRMVNSSYRLRSQCAPST